MVETSDSLYRLLSAADGPAYRETPGRGDLPVILLCEHASNRVPERLNNLGLSALDLGMHFAVDVGAARVTELLADQLGVPAVFCNFSRLVVDCNRTIAHPQLMTTQEDGVTIPGNQKIAPAERQARIAEIYQPFHDAVAHNIAALEKKFDTPHIVIIHSHTPQYRAMPTPRPWQIGVTWNNKNPAAAAMLQFLQKSAMIVGDNQPYALFKPDGAIVSHTMAHHVENPNRSGYMVEIRHDQIRTEAGCATYAALLADGIKATIAPCRAQRPLPSPHNLKSVFSGLAA